MFPSFWAILLVLTSLGLGLAASALMVKYRDVAYVIPWLLQVGLFATPVAYSLSAVPSEFRLLFYLNPLSWLVELFRSSMLGSAPSAWWLAPAAVVVSVAVLLAGVIAFQSQERAFADLI